MITFLEILIFPFTTFVRYMQEKAPYHRILLSIYLLFTTALLLGGIEISWFGEIFFDNLITLVLIWFIYPFIALPLEHKHSSKHTPQRARKFFEEHLEHLSNEEIEYHLKQKH